MKIKFLGGSSFLIKTEETTVILDPTSDKGVNMKKQLVDICIISDPKYSDQSMVESAKKEREMFSISGQGEYEVGGVFVDVTSYHGKATSFDKDLVVHMRADDINILYLGYLNHSLTKKEIESYSNIHVIIAPIGDKTFISYEGLDEVINAADPAIFIPSVYKEGKNHSGILEVNSLEDFLKHHGTKEPEHEKTLTIKASDFEGEEDLPMRIVVLDAE